MPQTVAPELSNVLKKPNCLYFYFWSFPHDRNSTLVSGMLEEGVGPQKNQRSSVERGAVVLVSGV